MLPECGSRASGPPHGCAAGQLTAGIPSSALLRLDLRGLLQIDLRFFVVLLDLSRDADFLILIRLFRLTELRAILRADDRRKRAFGVGESNGPGGAGAAFLN